MGSIEMLETLIEFGKAMLVIYGLCFLAGGLYWAATRKPKGL